MQSTCFAFVVFNFLTAMANQYVGWNFHLYEISTRFTIMKYDSKEKSIEKIHHTLMPMQWPIYIVKFWMYTPGGPNHFNFMQFFGNFGKIVC